MAGVKVLEELCSARSPQLILDVSQPVADGGHGQARETRYMHSFLRAEIVDDVLSL